MLLNALGVLSQSPYSGLMGPKYFKPVERAAEKATSRAEDARAIAAGEKTVEQVRRENASFAFPGVQLRFPARER